VESVRRDTHKAATVGLVIAIALVLGAMAILTVGREQGLFRDRVPFRTDFPNVDGLSVGAPVRLIGVQVGIVTGITLPEDIGGQRVEVEFGVERAYRDRIRQGTTATLRHLTYLSGEKYVELKPGDPERGPIPDGGYIESPRTEVEQLITQSQNIAANLETISEQFTELLDALNRGESVLSQLIRDPTFGRQAMEEATTTVANLNQIVARIEAGEGLLGRLVADDEFGRTTAERLVEVLERLERIGRQLEAGEGFLGQLLAQDSELLATQRELRELVADLRSVLGKVESGQGLAGQLLTDADYGRTMADRLDAILADVGSILRKLDEGEGTLGRLINEPELYDQATDVVGGISDRRFLSWVAKRVRNKEVKAKIEEYIEELEKAEKAATEGG
jgi:phospholipid/cholesterol/gamma-HCH transport system substrate-binding protein